MPPRFTYWTIILDGQPTAFRAAERGELLPTLKQLQAKNPAAVLKWFARGRVWESPEEARRAREEEGAAARAAATEKARGREWRPGGEHRDPREKFKKETFQARKRREKKAADLARRAGEPGWRPRGDAARPDARHERPRQDRPHQDRPHQDRPREGGWQRDANRPARPRFEGDRQRKEGFAGSPRSQERRGEQGYRGGASGRPKGDHGKPPYHQAPPRPQPRRPGPAEAPPELPRKVAEPRPQATEPRPQVMDPRPKTTEPARELTQPPRQPATPPAESFPPGPPAPAHKTRLPRLRKDDSSRGTE